MSVDIRRFTKKKQPTVAYAKVAERVLPGWDISLVFAGEDRAQALNVTLRGKDYVPNVLSYETGAKSGEIIICLTEAEKQAPSYGLSYPQFVAYLFIHGLCHLKGMPHGARMERYERTELVRMYGTHSLRTWHDAFQPGSTSARTRPRSSSSKK